MTVLPVVGVYDLYLVNDYISNIDADKEMHILDNAPTPSQLIWGHQLYLGGVFGHV